MRYSKILKIIIDKIKEEFYYDNTKSNKRDPERLRCT